jgi:hypothetical protein
MEKGTNKNTFVSVGKYALLGIGVALLWKFVQNSYKKELKGLSEKKEKEDKDIESLGVSPERMRDQVYDCEREVDRNMVKAIYVGMEAKVEKNSDYSEMIDLDRVLSSQAIVHVTEERGGYKGMKYLIFLFEIPDSALEKKGNFTVPRIGDYYVSLRELKDHLCSREVVYFKEPIGKMTAYLAYSYKDPKEGDGNVTTTVEIPRSIWSRWEDEHDGLVEFYEDVRKNGLNAIKKKGILDEFQDFLTNDFLAKNPDSDPSEFAIHYEDFILAFKIGFREARTEEENGITVKTALDCIRHISEDFEVIRKGSDKGGVKYDRFLFHAPNENGIFDSLTRYYTTGKGGKIIFDSYSYPEEEEEKEPTYSPNSIKNNVTIKTDKRLND